MIVSDPRWLRLVRSVVRACCREFDPAGDDSRAIVSASDEAVSNVIRHAYRGDTTRPIRIACRFDGNGFEIEISDLGKEFDPLAQPLPRPDELRVGGRGLFLIRTAADDCEYERDGKWNRLKLRKFFGRPGGTR